MRSATQTSQKQTSLFTGEESTSLPEASPARLLAMQECNSELMMNDIYFQKCLEQSERLGRSGLLVKMFMPLLHENLQTSSKRYVHRWKLKGTKFNRLLFQLRRLGPNTKDIEHGLLPTPMASDFRDRGTYWDACNQRRLEIGKQVGLSTLFAKTPCPSCVIHIMGFPENWLSKPFTQPEMP